MSYCRFSSDDFKSDIYCYEAEDGIVIHVASMRYEGLTDLPKYSEVGMEKYLEAIKKRSIELNKAHRVYITAPYAGDSFYGLNHQETYEKLLELKEFGYHVPEYAIATMKEDAENEDC